MHPSGVRRGEKCGWVKVPRGRRATTTAAGAIAAVHCAPRSQQSRGCYCNDLSTRYVRGAPVLVGKRGATTVTRLSGTGLDACSRARRDNVARWDWKSRQRSQLARWSSRMASLISDFWPSNRAETTSRAPSQEMIVSFATWPAVRRKPVMGSSCSEKQMRPGAQRSMGTRGSPSQRA
jgi:hypothetical protein